jgi:protein SCO1
VALRRSALAAAFGALALCAGAQAAVRDAIPPPTTKGTPIPAGMTSSDFALRDQNGRLVKLSAQRGNLVLIAFLYTHCMDVCPLIATHLDIAVRALGRQASSVRVLVVSVDPVFDTPAGARAYIKARGLGPQFRWLLGTRDELAPVWQAYNVLVRQDTPEKIAHAAPIFLLDQKGVPRVFYEGGIVPGAITRDLRRLLSAGMR